MCPSDCGESSSARSSSGTVIGAGGAARNRSRPVGRLAAAEESEEGHHVVAAWKRGVGEESQQRGYAVGPDALARELGRDAVVVGVQGFGPNRLEIGGLRDGRLRQSPCRQAGGDDPTEGRDTAAACRERERPASRSGARAHPPSRPSR